MAPVIKDSSWLLSVNNCNFIHHMSMSTLFKMKLFTLNGRENRRGNQETLATLGAQGTRQIQAKQPTTTKRTKHGKLER
jgi:hypothetical protein